MKSAWVTRIDYALDIYGMRLSDYHVGFKGVCCGERYSSEDEFQGQLLGSRTSECYLSCYEKLDVGDDLVNLNSLDDEELQLKIANGRDIQPYRQFLRLEVRYKPKNKVCLLRNLRGVKKLLERIFFYKKPLLIKKGDLDWESLLLDKTLPELRKYIQDTHPESSKKLLRRFEKRLESNRMPIFNMDELWSDFNLLVDKLGILGNDALWQKNLREKWAKKHGYK